MGLDDLARWGVIGGALFLTDVKAGLGALESGAGRAVLGAVVALARIAPRADGGAGSLKARGPNGTAPITSSTGARYGILMQGDSIWIVADDVFDALELHGRQRNPARVRQIAGRDGLVKPPGSQRLAFSEINQGVARSAHRRRCAQVLILAGQAGDHTVSQTSGADRLEE